MDLFLLFCLVGCQLYIIDGASITTESELPSTGIRNGEVISLRKPRRIIRKIHSGVAFLAGVKVGTLLAHKGFDVGQGSIAASNNFQLFGKTITSAISLSYGGVGQKLPLLDEIPSNGTVNRMVEKEKEDIVHVAIVRNPSLDTIDKLRRISNVSIADLNQTHHDVIIVESDPTTTTKSPITPNEVRFIREHNKRVNEINREIQRRNSKF